MATTKIEIPSLTIPESKPKSGRGQNVVDAWAKQQPPHRMI